MYIYAAHFARRPPSLGFDEVAGLSPSAPASHWGSRGSAFAPNKAPAARPIRS